MTAIYISYLNRPDIEELALTNDEILGAIETSLAAQGRGFFRAGFVAIKRRSRTRPAGASTKELFKEIGGFNPNYRIAYWEDAEMKIKFAVIASLVW